MAESADVIALAKELLAIDTRSSVSNLQVVELLQRRLKDFAIERIDYRDGAGVAKAALVARRGRKGGPCVALSGHLDTVAPVGWTRDPFVPEIEGGRLFGLGASDMKGPVAAAVVAAETLPPDTPVMLLLTSDEETTKEGARRIVGESRLVAEDDLAGVIVVEPTSLSCIRGHRVDIQFRAEARGVQAHSSTPDGKNANIALIPFLAEMRRLHLKLRDEVELQDPNYTPPWCDLNIIIDNHGAAANVTVGRATCLMKFRYSKSIDPAWVVDLVRAAAESHGVALTVKPEGTPPELPAEHPLIAATAAVSGTVPAVVGFGTDASQFSAIAPCVIFGPGSIAQAHRPDEFIEVAELERAVPLLRQLVLDYLKRLNR